MSRDLFEDSAKYLPSIVIPAVVSIVAVPVVTRMFPAEDYGNYTLVRITITFLSSFAVSWIGSSTIRFFPAYDVNERLDDFRSTLLQLAIVSVGMVSLMCWGVLLIVRAHISADLHFLMTIGLSVFAFTSLSFVLLSLLRAKRQVTWYASFTIWNTVVGLGLGIAMVLAFRFGVEGLLWGTVASTAVALPFMARISLGKAALAGGRIRSAIVGEVFKYGAPIMAINVLGYVLSLSDRYILQAFRGSEAVGIYSASYAISQRSILFIVSLFHLASTPIAFSLWEKKGAGDARRFVTDLTRYYILIGLPAAVGLSVLASSVVSIMIPAQYYEGYRVIPSVCFGAFLFGLTHRFTYGLTFHKRTDLLMLCCLGSGLCSIALNLVLVPRYGYMAAARINFVSYAFLLLLTILVSRRFFVWKFPFKSLGRVAIASGIMGLVVYHTAESLTFPPVISLLVSVGVGVVVYSALIVLLREVTVGELMSLYRRTRAK